MAGGILGTWTPKKTRILFVVIILTILLILGVVLGVVLSNKDNDSGSGLITDKENYLSTSAQFPNGSYSLNINSLQAGHPDMTPLEVTPQNLSQWGVNIDNSSLVAEAGRLNYFYILLPLRSRILQSSNSIAVDISSIGVRFGSADSLRIIPLSLTSKPLSGLRLVKSSGLGELYELQVGMPPSICSKDEGTSCSVVRWTAYSISSDGKSGQGMSSPNILPVSCGSQCEQESNSACSTSTCQQCDGLQVAGADTPVTRRYYMGISTGKFNFQYETFSIPDRIRVFYGDEAIFDTGCVGANGQISLSFSGTSKEIRVDVEPNCRGTSGTAWNFKLSCPSPCQAQVPDGNDSFYLMNGVTKVPDGGSVYITKQGLMPQLTAYYCGTIYPNWLLTIKPSGSDLICSPLTFNGYGQVWSISFYNTQGGIANLTLSTTNFTKSLSFTILGTQPKSSDVITEINFFKGNIWFAEFVAKHESKLIQFNNNGFPLKSYDNGYGIFQLTMPVPTCDQIWNWKSNVRQECKDFKLHRRQLRFG